jgi:hypothetical protein
MLRHKYFWTDGQDTQIRRGRREGADWAAIAGNLSLALRLVEQRGHTLGLKPTPADFRGPSQDPEREPLPAGHPTSWDAINAGTVLQGQPYPLPFFRR